MATAHSGWYEDPDDPTWLRYWDGNTWTHDRRPASEVDGAPQADPVARGGRLGGRLGSARRLADNARTAGRSALETARDPSRQQAARAAAVPAFEAALDGAEVRNKHGEVKAWRVARAATRPRRTITGAGKGVVTATAGRLAAGASGGDRAVTRVAPTDDDIVLEWRLDDRSSDLERWREGVYRFRNSAGADPRELLAAARLVCDGLKHCLVGDPMMHDDAIVESAGGALMGLLEAVPVEAWDADHEKMTRLALAVVRRFGVQPEELGGNGELGDVFEEPSARMRMAMSVAPTQWSCDLSAWFTDGRS